MGPERQTYSEGTNPLSATIMIESYTPPLATQSELQELMQKYDIDSATLAYWEKALGIVIPTDEAGQKRYTTQHLYLFRNVKKYLALGRSLKDIKALVSLPPSTDSHPIASAAETLDTATEPLPTLTAPPKPFGSVPVKTTAPTLQKPMPSAKSPTPSSPGVLAGPATLGGLSASPNQAIQLVERLIQEKDELHRKLVEAEKLNSHLYNVNNLFHRKVKELTALVVKLKANNQEKVNMKLLDDKSKLQRQLLEAERGRLEKQRELDAAYKTVHELQKQKQELEEDIRQQQEVYNPNLFIGRWSETAELDRVEFDHFGLNLESTRSREQTFDTPPQRVYGRCAVLVTPYGYDDNPLWRRQEMLILSFVDKSTLTGELLVDYELEGATVCRAVYRVRMVRLADK